MKIIYLCGRICSGKSSYEPQYKRIKVSDIVRDIINSNDREKLQDTLHLEIQILDKINSSLIKCKQNKEEVIIVDGIRQPFILDQLNKIHPGEIHWLEVPVKEREKRYVKRNAKKDTQSFKDADNHPIELECQQIYRIFKNKLKIINN